MRFWRGGIWHNNTFSVNLPVVYLTSPPMKSRRIKRKFFPSVTTFPGSHLITYFHFFMAVSSPKLTFSLLPFISHCLYIPFCQNSISHSSSCAQALILLHNTHIHILIKWGDPMLQLPMCNIGPRSIQLYIHEFSIH